MERLLRVQIFVLPPRLSRRPCIVPMPECAPTALDHLTAASSYSADVVHNSPESLRRTLSIRIRSRLPLASPSPLRYSALHFCSLHLTHDTQRLCLPLLDPTQRPLLSCAPLWPTTPRRDALPPVVRTSTRTHVTPTDAGLQPGTKRGSRGRHPGTTCPSNPLSASS